MTRHPSDRLSRTPSQPAVKLFGEANWWSPTWLDRFLPEPVVPGPRTHEVIDLTDALPGQSDPAAPVPTATP